MIDVDESVAIDNSWQPALTGFCLFVRVFPPSKPPLAMDSSTMKVIRSPQVEMAAR